MSDWTAVAALAVSLSVYATQWRDTRRKRRADERAQAEQVAGWAMADPDTGNITAHVQNASGQPVYDLTFVIRVEGDESDQTGPTILPVVPPGRTLPFIFERHRQDDGPESFDRRLHMTFRDGRGRAWQRDTMGRLWPARRPVDVAPRPGIAGRIERRR